MYTCIISSILKGKKLNDVIHVCIASYQVQKENRNPAEKSNESKCKMYEQNIL